MVRWTIPVERLDGGRHGSKGGESFSGWRWPFWTGRSVYPEILYNSISALTMRDWQMGNHKEALFTLVHDLGDAASAEAYCALGGDVVPAKVAMAVAESCGLAGWGASLFSSGSVAKKPAVGALQGMKRQTSVTSGVDESLKRDLLKILLEVYMSDECVLYLSFSSARDHRHTSASSREASASRAAHLLSSQAMNLDDLDVRLYSSCASMILLKTRHQVVAMVPITWPLNVMSSFLSRSFRRTLHARHEQQLVKAISAGQNLEVRLYPLNRSVSITYMVLFFLHQVKDQTWLTLREEGMIVEEALSDDEGNGEQYDEKQMLAEKIALQLMPPGHGLDEIRNSRD